jgi:hypothetical protein
MSRTWRRLLFSFMKRILPLLISASSLCLGSACHSGNVHQHWVNKDSPTDKPVVIFDVERHENGQWELMSATLKAIEPTTEKGILKKLPTKVLSSSPEKIEFEIVDGTSGKEKLILELPTQAAESFDAKLRGAVSVQNLHFVRSTNN